MRAVRLIARLDIKGKNLIKSINLEGLRVVGDPNKFALKYYEDGADEIIFMDTVASLYGRNQLEKIISNATKNIFIPTTVGGGIRSLDDALFILKSGADKVALNSAAVKNPKLISEIANHIGSQSTVISIEAKKRKDKLWEVYIINGRERTKINVLDWIPEVEKLGAGEILLTSIDQEGTRTGFDVELAKAASKITNLPIIISGGFGKLTHIDDLKDACTIEAIAIADSLHYNRFNINTLKNKLLK